MLMKIKKMLLSFGLCVALTATSFTGFAAKTTRPDVSLGSISGAKVAPSTSDSSSWVYKKNDAQPVAVGQMESITVPINIPSNAPVGELKVSIQADTLDLNRSTLFIVLDKNGMLYPFTLNTQATASTLDATIETDAVMRQDGSQAYLYLSAPRKARGGSVNVEIRRPAPTAFGPNVTLSVGDYDISKQASGADPIEMAVGASGLLNVQAIYCISKNNSEVIRILVQNGSIMGLAIKDNDIVSGVEYSLNKKVYINTLTKEEVLTKTELIDIFNTFEFSFMRDPNESIWFSAQAPLQLQRSFQFSS